MAFDQRLPTMLCAPSLVCCLAIVNHQLDIIHAQDAPLVGQPTADYYGARGTGVKVAWSLDRDTVPEDGVIVATLTVSGADNPQQVTRPDTPQADPALTRLDEAWQSVIAELQAPQRAWLQSSRPVTLHGTTAHPGGRSRSAGPHPDGRGARASRAPGRPSSSC